MLPFIVERCTISFLVTARVATYGFAAKADHIVTSRAGEVSDLIVAVLVASTPLLEPLPSPLQELTGGDIGVLVLDRL